MVSKKFACVGRTIAVFLVVASPAVGAAQAPALPSDLAPVLFPADAGWRMGNYGSNAKSDLVVGQVDGQPVFRVGASGLTLTSRERIGGNVELTLRFRMSSPDDKGSVLAVTPGLADEKLPTSPLRLSLQIQAGPEPDSLLWSTAPLPDQKTGSVGRYAIPNLPKNRLTWPDLVRRRIEADTAAEPRLTARWLTLRYQLRPNEARIFLDDRALRTVRYPELETAGLVRITCTRGVEIGSLSVRPLPSTDPRFETVGLEGYINTDRFRGDKVVLDKRAFEVGSVPFVIPTPDERKRDHVELKPSWLACGLVPGDHAAAHYELARWRGALHREPGRIRFRVPPGQYTKLHLLAAFSGEPDTTPIVTAQFYRANSGAPVNFAGTAPLFSAPSEHAVAVSLEKGTKGSLHLVTIRLEPDGLSRFSDQDHLEFELTKQVRLYRSFPDPIEYSQHGGGLASGVHVFGITLERPAVEVDLQPDAFAHVWTAPAKPSYSVKLKNTSTTARNIDLTLTTTSFDGEEKTVVKHSAKLAPSTDESARLELGLKRYGHHVVELKFESGGETRTQRRTLAHLHPDTRERGGWQEGKGPIFGLWDWAGGHETPKGVNRLKVMAQAGMESSMTSFANANYSDEEKAFLESIGAKSFFLGYQLNMNKNLFGGKDWDPSKPAEMQAAIIEHLKKQAMAQPSKINQPELVLYFAEPLLGPVSYMSLPEYYGEPAYEMTADEKARYQKMLDFFVITGSAIKKEWPHAKLLLPWGIPSFPIPFLRNSKEARDLMDGPAIDIGQFERLPEAQMHQVTISNTMWQLKQEWLKSGKPWPTFCTIEGPCVAPAAPGALTPQQEADHTVRAYMILAAYGTTRHLGWPVGFHCQSYWGETHYGGGLTDPLPLLTPRPAFSAYATMTRQLNRMNFVKSVPTGSNTVFCYQFKHYKTGELLHVVWTLKGKRPVHVDVGGSVVTVYDSQDNPRPLPQRDGTSTFWASAAPCFVRGLNADAKISLGEPDHSDARPAAEHVYLHSLGSDLWKMSDERDAVYEDSHTEFIRRFPGKFSTHNQAGTKEFGQARVIHLEKQEKERKTMPFYTTLVPPKAIVIPGRASHLGLWVKASSDWGRVVYCLKDAKGERWVSVGLKGEWNVDDVHCWSHFCFDGIRYLRFELPGNAPYDLYREAGTSFWGHYGEGDAIVDYPLALEKVIVERRTHVIAGTELVRASADDIWLGELFAEYETAADKTPEAVRLAKLRMPVPAGVPDLANPLKKLKDSGVGDGPTITKIAPPEREYDGKRCHVYFDPSPKAAKYHLWVSPYADGRGAVLLGNNWTEPGQLLTGLSPNIDLYIFVVSIDVAGASSKPGVAFKVNLKDMFPMR